ncbi:MAG: hypothetical protein R6X02_10225 [Enhygromyxa sp.]
MSRLAAALTLSLVSLTTLACRKVPADVTLPQADSEPARTGVFVEAQPEPREPASGGFAPISAEIEQLYRCWFRNPYSYMFRPHGAALEVNGQEFGMLMGGIRGILFYGDLNTCAGELSGQPSRSYSDIKPIEALAGVSATLPNASLKFATVNPEFIAYARQTLLPAPEQAIDGVPVQLAYDLVFQRFFRVMSLSLIRLLEVGNIDAETQQYLAATSAGTDGIEWLESSYSGFVPGDNEHWDGTTMTAPMAVGFWLRRHADGSLAACWYGLRDVLIRYDNPWLGDQLAHNPKAAAALALLADPMETQ